LSPSIGLFAVDASNCIRYKLALKLHNGWYFVPQFTSTTSIHLKPPQNKSSCFCFMSDDSEYLAFIDLLCESICQGDMAKSKKFKIILKAKYPYAEPMRSNKATAGEIRRNGFGFSSIEKATREICQLLPIVKESDKNENNLENWLGVK
jgi:hypothetical protein